MRTKITCKKIYTEIAPKIIKSLSKNKGLNIFAVERSKFEGWLKVEICNILIKSYPDLLIVPELNKHDIVVSNNVAIELKTVNTSYKTNNVKKKTRPITSNVKGIINDIKKLKKSNYEEAIIIYIVFPLELNNNPKWSNQLGRIKSTGVDIKSFTFKFNNSVPGILYLGRVKKGT